jgi:sulfur transfer complex TusBCD TusB component (DsrH family)
MRGISTAKGYEGDLEARGIMKTLDILIVIKAMQFIQLYSFVKSHQITVVK